MMVGRKLVVPVWARREATSQIEAGFWVKSSPKPPLTWMSIQPGVANNPVASMTGELRGKVCSR